MMHSYIINKVKGSLLAGVLATAACIVTSCAHEQLCEEEHPHKAWVEFNYDWTALSSYTNQKPDSMLILVDRVIYQHMNTLAYDTKTESGKYLSERPADVEAEDNHDVKRFAINSGEYKFLTMNMSSSNFDYSGLEAIVKNNAVSQLKHADITYKTYPATSPLVNIAGSGLTDANLYAHIDGSAAEFILDDKTPVVLDSVPISKWLANEVRTINFQAKPITHNIDLFFDIKKDVRNVDFYIESVYVIISGIPHTINLSSGALDVSNTDKMFFKTDLVDPTVVPNVNSKAIADTKDNNVVRCYKNLTVTGIVENDRVDDDAFYGPGIMQVVINAKVKDGADYVPKKINAMVNMHKSLQNAKLQTYNYEMNTYRKSREHSDLYVSLNVLLDKTTVLGDGTGGIIKWQEADVPTEFNIY